MRFLRYLVLAFVDVFGITRPTERGANRAVWFIASLLAAAGLLLFGVFFGTLHLVR